MIKDIKLSVVMSVYNQEKYVIEAIESVLGQTFTNFEFIIIDDCSSDTTGEIIANFAQMDKRIRVVKNEVNIGLTKSLIKGVRLARGEYIARTDGDDVSLPKRFEKQIAFLDQNPEVWALGSQVQFIDEEGTLKNAHNYPADRKILRWNAIINGPVVIHSTVMMRKVALETVGNYPNDCQLAQDAALWRKMYMSADFPIANLKDILVHYRIHAASLGHISRIEQIFTVLEYQKKLYEHILKHKEEIEIIEILNFPSRSHFPPLQAKNCIGLLLRLFKKFRSNYSLNSTQLGIIKKTIGVRIFSIGYRYPIRLCPQNLQAIFFNPPVIFDYLNQYLKWLAGIFLQKQLK